MIASDPSRHLRLRDLALIFLRLGVTTFGGPAAHLAMMEQEFVSRRRYLTREKFLDLVGAASLLPGPSSSEVALYIGQLLAGFPGLLLAGVCFILPAALIVLGLAWVYVRFGRLPQVSGALYGIKPVIVAVVAQALVSLGRTAIKTRLLAVIAAFALILNALGADILIVLLCAGLGSAALAPKRTTLPPLLALAPMTKAIVAGPFAATPTLTRVFFFFLKLGAVQFGSGYVLLAFLNEDLVKRWHWLTETELLDATSVGQFTPGPVFTTATFIGYLLHGTSGAVLATVAIFLPAFIFVSFSGPVIPRIRQSAYAGAFLDGVIVASLAAMAFVSWTLARAALIDGVAIALFALALFTLIRFRVNSAWLVLVGAIVGSLKLSG